MPRRAISNVNVMYPYGDSFLGGSGIGHANVDAHGTITQIDCGVFAQNKPLPQVGKEYVITGDFDDDPKIPFKATLTCAVANRPVSQFS